MRKQAIEAAVRTVRMNLGRFGNRFPHVGKGGAGYRPDAGDHWTNGFWSGLLWLCAEHTGEAAFRDKARETVRALQTRLDAGRQVDHHDLGFLYSLSAKAEWLIERDSEAQATALRAADLLAKRWRPAGGYLQAWGPEGDPDNGGRIIIDSLMNLPLLYWAAETDPDRQDYGAIAELHAEKCRKYLLRGDGSSFHTFRFDPRNGEPLRGGTAQGYSDGSTWTRGQAWGIYGFALSYRYTGKPQFLNASRRMAEFFFARLPADSVAYWDFDVPPGHETGAIRDTSASAIAAAGALELIGHLEQAGTACPDLRSAAESSLNALVAGYAAEPAEDAGLLREGAYHVRADSSVCDYTIWGDYFYLEALLRAESGLTGYWHEREERRGADGK